VRNLIALINDVEQRDTRQRTMVAWLAARIRVEGGLIKINPHAVLVRTGANNARAEFPKVGVSVIKTFGV
jgi:hypothetical protein